MEKKSNSKVQGQLDFNAPLMSMRRITGSPIDNETVDCKVDGTLDWAGKSPVYRSELKSGPLRNPGTVPFLWEQSPGRPKDEEHVRATHNAPTPRAPSLPPGRTLTIKQGHINSADVSSNGDMKNNEQGNIISSNGFQQSNSHPNFDSKISTNSDHAFASSIKGKSNGTVSNRPFSVIPFSQNHAYEDGLGMDCDDFSDALETLSQTETCTAACSVSLVSGMEDQDLRSSSRFVDQQTRNFMIDRFLPAAKAMASESPQQTSRRPPVHDLTMPLNKGRENREPLPLQSRPYIMKREIKDEEEDNEISGFSSKSCGFFPWRFRNALCHLNPVSHAARMKKKKALSLLPAPKRGNGPRNLSDREPLSDSDDEDLTWEAIYRQKNSEWEQIQWLLEEGK